MRTYETNKHDDNPGKCLIYTNTHIHTHTRLAPADRWLPPTWLESPVVRVIRFKCRIRRCFALLAVDFLSRYCPNRRRYHHRRRRLRSNEEEQQREEKGAIVKSCGRRKWGRQRRDDPRDDSKLATTTKDARRRARDDNCDDRKQLSWLADIHTTRTFNAIFSYLPDLRRIVRLLFLILLFDKKSSCMIWSRILVKIVLTYIHPFS